MNLKNLGSPLSRDEQKQIKGGVLQCEVGKYVKCTCGCVENTGSVSTPASICAGAGCGTPIQLVCWADAACSIT